MNKFVVIVIAMLALVGGMWSFNYFTKVPLSEHALYYQQPRVIEPFNFTDHKGNNFATSNIAFCLVYFSLLVSTEVESLQDGLHPTPMMGFSSWNAFFSTNNEEKMIGTADAIKRLELDKFGYIYVTVDDKWNTPDRDERG